MALTKTALSRKFIYKGRRLDDIPGKTEQEVIKIHAATNPELVNATFEFAGIENEEQVYKINATGGSKG